MSSNTRVTPVVAGDDAETSSVRLFRDPSSTKAAQKSPPSEPSKAEDPASNPASSSAYGDSDVQRAVTVSGNEHRQRNNAQKNIKILTEQKFTSGATKSYGSRMVGGKKPTNLAVYRSFESVSYLTPDTAEQESLFMRMTPGMSGQLRCLLWFRYTVTGVVVSLAIAGALKITGMIENARVYETTKHLDGYYNKGEPDVLGAWGFWVGTSLGMNIFAVCMVLIQPAAASSGIPGLISFLNGVEPPGGKSPLTKKTTSFVSIRTMVCKFLGMLASIPSGLCIGPEGPIIHISALLAFWTTRVIHKIQDAIVGPGFDEDTEHERRDFLATGAACGICTAFRAPLAGTLFVVEEAGSFFTTTHLEFTFFACLVSYWVQWVIGYLSGAKGATGAKFVQETGFFCNNDSPLNMVAYVLMAIGGGVLGALFNQIVEHLNHHRAHHINKHGWKRVIEVLFLTTLTGTVVVFLPMGAACRGLTRDIMLEDSAGCFPDKDLYQVSYGSVSHDFMTRLTNMSSPLASGGGSRRALSGNGNNNGDDSDRDDNDNDNDVTATSASIEAAGAGASRNLINPRATRNLAVSDDSAEYYGADEGDKNLMGDQLLDPVRKAIYQDKYRAPKYTADKSKKIRAYKEHDIVMLDNFASHGVHIHIHYEHTYMCPKAEHSYNDMAMLWLNGGVYGVKALMQRGFPHQLSEQTLAIFLVVYFTLAAITSGTHVPAGLVVPMLLIGGSFGRLFGLVWLRVKKAMCTNYVELQTLSVNGTYPSSPYVTPSGVEHYTYDMYQWASQYRWMIRDCTLPDPGVFAVIGMAAFMGGSGRISVMLAIVMLELTGDAGLIAPVGLVCILSMLVGNLFNHGLYHGLIPIMNIPYLNAVPAQVMFVSRVTEIMASNLVCLPQHCSVDQLRVLQMRMFKGRCSHNAFPVVKDNFSKELVGLLSRVEMDKIFAHLEGDNEMLKSRIMHPLTKTIDLTQYCDRSPLTVTTNSTVSRAYEVFRKLGLRHLVVLGRDGGAAGMITRKDLMVFKLVDQKQRELVCVKKLQGRVRNMLEKNGYYERNPTARKARGNR
jgi:H+/Cl- antiporter ClcA